MTLTAGTVQAGTHNVLTINMGVTDTINASVLTSPSSGEVLAVSGTANISGAVIISGTAQCAVYNSNTVLLTNCSLVNSKALYAVYGTPPIIVSANGNNYTQYATPTGTITMPSAATIMGPWTVTNSAQGTATQVGPWPITKNPDGTYNIGPWPVK